VQAVPRYRVPLSMEKPNCSRQGPCEMNSELELTRSSWPKIPTTRGHRANPRRRSGERPNHSPGLTHLAADRAPTRAEWKGSQLWTRNSG
jgi:hypothetical protein